MPMLPMFATLGGKLRRRGRSLPLSLVQIGMQLVILTWHLLSLPVVYRPPARSRSDVPTPKKENY